jgi:hypothetical protein
MDWNWKQALLMVGVGAGVTLVGFGINKLMGVVQAAA